MKKSYFGALLLASTMALAACSTGGATAEGNIATTNAGNVTQKEFYDALVASSGQQTLQKLVLTKILEKDAENAKALKEEADTEVASQVAQYGGEDALLSVLAQNGFASVDAYKETVYLNKLITAAVKKATTFSEEDLKAAYDAYEPEITVQHILIGALSTSTDEEKAAAKKKAEELIKELDNGADFAELAKANSTDTGSAENGGTIGPFKRSDMVTEFSDAAYALEKVGDYTKEPVLTSYGYHIIKLTDKPEKQSYDEMKSQLEEDLLNEKLADTAYIHSVLSDLVKAADVKISNDTLKDAMSNFIGEEETTTSADETTAAGETTAGETTAAETTAAETTKAN